MVYKKKKDHPELEALKQLVKSKYWEKVKRRSKDIENNPTFQRELEELRKKHSYPKNEKELFKYIDRIEKRPKAKGEREIIYFKEWHDFCDKWGIEYIPLVCFGIVQAKGTVKLYSQGKGKEPLLKPISGNATGQDIRDNLPFFMAIKDYNLGKPPIMQGRKRRTEQYRQMRKEFKLLKKKMKSKDAIKVLSDKNSISEIRTHRIVYSKTLT